MDLHYKYDGTTQVDYEVKVEVVHLDEKAEKEQLTYMAVGNTKPDIDLLANYISEINYSDVGLDVSELNDILAINDLGTSSLIDSLDDLLSPVSDIEISDNENTYEEKKDHMKAVKQQVREAAIERQQNEDAYITLSFSTYQTKSDFCDLIGVSADDKFAKGEDVLKIIT